MKKESDPFRWNRVHLDFIKPVTAREKAVIKKFIKENPKAFLEFNAYHKPIDSLLNLSFYVKDEDERRKFKAFAHNKFSNIREGLKDTQIVDILQEKSTDNRSSIRNITLQFVAVDSEVSEMKYRYTQMNILDF